MTIRTRTSSVAAGGSSWLDELLPLEAIFALVVAAAIAAAIYLWLLRVLLTLALVVASAGIAGCLLSAVLLRRAGVALVINLLVLAVAFAVATYLPVALTHGVYPHKEPRPGAGGAR